MTNKLHTCPKGHQWEAPADETDPACPYCLPTVTLPPPSSTPPRPGEHEKTLILPPTDAGEAPTLSPAGAEAALLPAVDVPGYKVLGLLGRGGMGVVYKARDIRLNRLVALKMVLAGAHASPSHLARFKAEAETVARLAHPNIVQIYDIGEASSGPGVVHPFMALEYCPGGSLSERLDGTPVPPRPAAELVETLARAMRHAHDAGILHRDLKPANVLLASGERKSSSLPSPQRGEGRKTGPARRGGAQDH
jgi:serine/threonine protein kinase